MTEQLDLTHRMRESRHEFVQRNEAPADSSADWYVDVAYDTEQDLIHIIQFLTMNYNTVVSVQPAATNQSCQDAGGDVRIWMNERTYEEAHA
jgi:hypothetical protein